MHATRTEMNPIHSRLSHIILFSLLLMMMLPGCGGKGSDNPAIPEMDGDGGIPELTAAVDYPASTPGTSGQKAVWGVWDISLDAENGFQIVPIRQAEYSLNVVTFLQPPMGSVSNIQIDMINMEKLFIAGEVVVDVSLTHPFPQFTQFTGFDVLGVVIGTARYIANSDIGIHYPQPDMDPVLKNADGYTRWMNQMEFTTEGLLGYTEGALGNKNQFWGSSLNGYKYFATNLYSTQPVPMLFASPSGISQRGMFSANSTNTRRYELDFPMVDGKPIVKFQYAVVASWAEPANNPPLSIPGDFPAEANMQEAFYCEISTVGSSLFWNNMYDNGGNLFLTLDVYDWQGMGNSTGVAGEIRQIVLDSPDEFINNGSKMVFNPGDWTELPAPYANAARLALDIGPVEPGGPCPYDNDVLITIVTVEQDDYDNGLGGAYPTNAILSGYARLFYDFGNVCNDPPVVWFTNCPEYPVGVTSRTFQWDGEDDVTPNIELQYRYKYDDDAWSGWETDVKVAYIEGMTEAAHTILVECRDMDGQVSQTQCVFEVELPPEPQPPNVSFVNCNPYVRSSTYTWNLSISDDNSHISQIKVRYQYDGGGWVNLPDGSTSITLNGLVSGGPHQLIVEVEDIDGMTDQADCEFDVNFRPTVSIDNCPGLDVNVNNYTFNWSGMDPEADPLEYQSRLNAGAWSAWGPATSRLLTGLGSGNHTFYVNVRDSTGGTNQTSCGFKVNFAPSISITNKPTQDVNTTSYTFNWTASDDLDSPLTMEYNVELDGVWQGWQTGISSYNWNPVNSGTRAFRVRVRDTGNPGLTADDLCNFIVNFKPTVTIDNCPGGVWASSDITFNWTGIDDNTPEAGMSYSYKLDSDPWSAWQLGLLSVNLVGLAEADHTFDVRVRDTGNPVLYCYSVPDTCDSCDFTIDTSCAFPPPEVQNFQASDSAPLLNNREVELTWDVIPACVNWYDIERLEYDDVTGWQWNPLISVADPATSWTDTDARYCGSANPISYRIRARNATGTSPTWATDTGYPLPRNVKIALWCVADDGSGTNPSTPWPRAAADYQDCNDFWVPYGVNYVLQNAGNFFWIGDPSLKDLTGNEDRIMHQTYGQVWNPDAINVYFVVSSGGSTNRGYCMCYCPGTNHNTFNVFIVLCRDTRGNPPNENHIVLAHENGHGVARYFDAYLLDGPGRTCATEVTWCTIPPMIPPLYCDDNSTYPSGGDPPVPKNLMWYSYVGAPVTDYDTTVGQYIWTDTWIHGYEGNYPWP